MSVIQTDVLVIGGGPGGYTAAIRSAQLGQKTLLVEKDKVGGTCLNRGCIPTKVYLKAAELLYSIEKAPLFGIKIAGHELDLQALRQRKERVVDTLVAGVKSLLKANGVELKSGTARFKNDNTVIIDGQEEITAQKIIIATGSNNLELSIPGTELPGVLNSDEALELKEIPESIAIIGGGVIGVEFAEFYASLGVKVTILEALPRILPLEDAAISKELQKLYTSRGITIHASSFVTEIRKAGSLKELLFETEGQKKTLQAEQVLVAVGRRANIDSLALDNAGVTFDTKGIKVNENLQTTNPAIYAIGDVNGGIQLAHVAFYEGEKAAEHIAGKKIDLDYKVVPRCIFSNPEIASVGLTEEEAKEKGYALQIGVFPFRANGKALLMDAAEGFMKIIAEKDYNEILGVHIIGPAASELIVEAALALKLECTIEEIIETIHAHPTVGESYRETAMDVWGRAIHFKR
jgi:dihydrolipoamide dehydrogenase